MPIAVKARLHGGVKINFSKRHGKFLPCRRIAGNVGADGMQLNAVQSKPSLLTKSTFGGQVKNRQQHEY